MDHMRHMGRRVSMPGILGVGGCLIEVNQN